MQAKPITVMIITFYFFSNEIWENKRQEKDKAKTVMEFFAKYVSYQMFF